METTILLVEDEEQMLGTIKEFLQGEGFRIVTAKTGLDALAVAKAEKPALVVLDWMLPRLSGIEVCKELRKEGTCGIVMVTAKAEETDKIIALEIGADDYLTKPFSLRELASRIRSVLRRIRANPETSPFMQRGNLSISELKCEVVKDGKEIALTPTEFKILLALAGKPGIVYSRLQLMKASMEEDFVNYERTMDSHISNLRKKLEDDSANPRYIQTVYGFGYRFGDRI